MNKKKNLIMGIFLLAGVSFLFSSMIQQETAKELFERALYLEETKGDLEKAIEVYLRVVKKFPDEQATAAKAQLQIGICYEKLGMKEAQTAYQQVIDKYPKQTDVVAVARERLAGIERSLAELNRQPKFRKIEIATKPQNGVLSPEGNKLAFISEGAVWVVPLHGKVDPDIAGEPVRLAEVPGVWDNGSLMAWSTDGEWIAVNGKADDEDAVYVIPAAGGKPLMVRMPERGGHAWGRRLSLSPDGQKVAISALELGTREEVPESHNRRIYTIPTVGGEPKQVSSSWARLPSFSPDGQLIAYVGYRKRDDWRENTERLRYDGDLWVVDAAGGTPVKLANVDGRLRGPVWSPDGKYIAGHHEPGTTNDSKEILVYPLSPRASSASEPIKISLPRSSWNMLAGWTPDGELGAFIQSEQHSAIYTVPASGGKAVQITPEAQWPYYPRWSPDGERIYFRAFNEDEKVTTVYVPAAGGDPVEVPLRSERWLVSIVPGGGLNVSPDGEMIVVSAYQEPYDPKEGVDVWTIPVNGGRPTRLTSDGSFEGYPCWSPDGQWVAFTDRHEKSEDEGFKAIYIVPAEGGEIRQITSEEDSVGGGAIAFSPDGERIAFFSGGAIKTIPVEGGQPEVLVAEVRSGRHSQLAYSPDGLKIAHNAQAKIWIAPLDGGKPEELRTGLPKDVKLSEFSWSPDGKKIAFFASIGGEAEFWLISDFLPQKR
jgi:Tol biopolymer transport system component